MNFNELDCIILLLLFVSGMIGILRGFVKETLQLVSFIIALLGAFFFRSYFTFLFSFIGSELIKQVITAISVFIIMFIIGSIVVYLICQTINMQGLGRLIDRLLGLSFGFLRGCFIVIIASMILQKNDTIASNNKWKESTLLIKINKTYANLSKYIPINLQEKVNQLLME